MLRSIASQLMAHVTVTPAENGALVRPYAQSPEYAYMVLSSSELVSDGQWMREKVRTHILKGETAILEKFAQQSKGVLPGRIVVREFLESAIPAELMARLNKTQTFEEAVEPFLKRAGQDGPVLTREGQRIVRFTDYDPAGTMQDISIAHDNVAEVSAWKSAQAGSGSANLPK